MKENEGEIHRNVSQEKNQRTNWEKRLEYGQKNPILKDVVALSRLTALI